MKVKRKSEIAEAVAEAQGAYVCGRFEMPARHVKAFEKWLKDTVEQALAAHYEPVPAAPSVSEEQPAPAISSGLLRYQDEIAPHRATIAIVPHSAYCNQDCGKWIVEVDGVPWSSSDTEIWLGTEAEAKAKMESLRGENNGA